MFILLYMDLPTDPKALYELGLNAYNRKNYKEAEKIFKRLIYSTSPNEYTDDAQYFLALVYFQRKQYDLSKSEVEFFVRNYRNSEFYPDALILLSRIYYETHKNIHRDISEINKAIEIINRVKNLYPDYNSKADSILYLIRKLLADKILISANVYRNLEKKRAEAIYLEYYLKNYGDINPDSVALRLLEIYDELNEREKIIKLTDIILQESFPSWLKKLAMEKREKYGNSDSRR
ncbi:MAG: outer membrane protein assembly factor BamD [candidate division WOR-3 bacterium]|nr:outer membrane protein assembly factor BamD [candidate division WOR-3 bacterium]MCX7948402.1 outer membrane protein assembly factor BamD [candidate division WOR-3 bacterium]MDW8150386.1 outer membrane protein assembly factor BamD [candidate division WOR-3 bacterium]